MKKKVLAALLSASMVMGIAACGQNSTPATTEDNTETQETETEAEATTEENSDVTAGIDGWEPFSDKVTLRVAVYDRGDNGNGCSDVENNYWTKWVQENFGDKYNIDVQYVGITRSDVMTDYAMLASTGELPTLCMEYDYDKLATWVADGYLQPYDVDEFKTIAPTYFQNMVDNGLTNYIQMQGDNYLVVGNRPYGASTYTFCTWYRQDWLEEAGYTELPTKNSELLDLYAKLVENGHEYPLSGSKVSGAGVDQNYAYRDYPQDETTWATTGDYQIPALSTEAQKRLLKWNNELYNDGFLKSIFYCEISYVKTYKNSMIDIIFILHLEVCQIRLLFLRLYLCTHIHVHACMCTHAHFSFSTHTHACIRTYTHFSLSVLKHLKISCRQHGMYISKVQHVSSKNKNIFLHNQSTIIICKILTGIP